MNSKRLVRLVGIVAIACATSVAAQQGAPATSNATSMDTLRLELQRDRRALFDKALELTDREAKAFWPLHEQYRRELEQIARRQNLAILDYIHAEDRMTDANASRIARQMLTADRDEQRLREAHYRKVLGVLPGRKAARYIQLEQRIDTLLHYDLAQVLPLAR